MLVENIMYFALGLLTAALVALVIMPAVWRRAVRLTKRRIEAATPISMAEFRADKDHLRADFALQTRRLELTIENLRARLSEQLSEVAQARVDAGQIKIERDQHTAFVAEANRREELLRQRLSELEKLNAELAQRQRLQALQPPPEKPSSPSPALAELASAKSAPANIVEAEAEISRAETRLNAILAKSANGKSANSAPTSLLADELSQMEASEALRQQVQTLEQTVGTTWQSTNFDAETLRKELIDIAGGISRLVYQVEDKPKPALVEESLFDRIKRFASDGETEDTLPAPAVSQRGTVTDRLAALRELRGN